MNAERRKNIRALINRLQDGVVEGMEADTTLELLNEVKDDIESLQGEEQDYYDNMPEGFQNGSKGDAAQEAISNFDTALQCMDNALGVWPGEFDQEAQDYIASEVADAISALEDASA